MYAFIHIPKTAGTTFRHILRCHYGTQHCDIKAALKDRASHKWIGPEEVRRMRRVYPTLAGICGHRVVPFTDLESVVPEVRFFTMLREPRGRLVSHFLHFWRGRIDEVTPDDLASYCADPANRNLQTRWLSGSEDAVAAIRQLDERVQFVGLSEAFNESMLLFHRWLGDETLSVDYQSRNRCHQRPKWPILDDPALESVVAEANQADLAVYAHARDLIFPAQKRAYGDALAADVEQFEQRIVHAVDQSEPLSARLKRNLVYKPALHLGLV